MHNKRLLNISLSLAGQYPEARLCNGVSYSKTTALSFRHDSQNEINSYMIYLADMNRAWLYLDLAGSLCETKLYNWFSVYTSIDFLVFQKALNSVYEIVRREHLAMLSLSSFKARVKCDTGFPATLLLAPLWSQIEQFFLSKDKSDWASTVRKLVQWCRANHKLRLKLDGQQEAAYEKFRANDQRLSTLWAVDDSIRDEYCSRMKIIISKWINDSEFSPDKPHMSSGASAMQITGRNITRKIYFSHPTGDQRLQFFCKRFNIALPREALHAYVNFRHDVDSLRTARFLTVDKNVVEGRGIGPQDPTLMWCQQAVKEWFYDHFFTTAFAKRHMPIFDRTVNMSIAKRASMSNRVATWDLSSASDSVSTPLIKKLFGPNIRAALLCCKSDRFDIGERFTTYATMGDASTFPVETIVIGACIKLAIDLAVEYYHERNSKPPFDPNEWSTFGDDITCPNDRVVTRYLLDILGRVGFTVNIDKSFIYGPYRESCGVEAYLGEEIQPEYFRPHLESKASLVASLIHICNAYYIRGYKSSRQYWLSVLSQMIGRRNIPFTENPDDGARVYTPYIDVLSLRTKYNRDTQELEIVSKVIRSPFDDSSSTLYNGNYALYAWLASNRERDYLGPVVIKNHLKQPRDTLFSIFNGSLDDTCCSYDERRVKLTLRAVPVRLLVRA